MIGDTATTGDLLLTDSMVKDWLNEGVRDVISKTPKQKLLMFAKEGAAFAPTTGVAVETRKIIDVMRNDGDIDIPCRQIAPTLRGRASDAQDFKYATEYDPVYYIDPTTNATSMLKILPVSTQSLGKVIQVNIPEVNGTAVSINGFPDEIEALPIKYAAISAKRRESALSRRLAQTEIEAIMSGGLLDKLSNTSSGAYEPAQTALDAATSALGSISGLLVTASGTMVTDEDIELGGAEIQSALSFAQEAQGYLQEAGARLGKGDLYLKEANARFQNAQHYLAHAQGALAEIQDLKQDYETALQNYIKI